MPPSMDIDPVPRLVALLRTHAGRLNGRVVAEMYENPFWEDRFGARGRRFAQEDGESHVAHLVLALEGRSPALLTSYVRWLQRVLTTRGVCSRHVAENFQRLAAVIREERWDGAGLAVEYLDGARSALRHGSEPARSIEESEPALVGAAVASGAADRLPRGEEDVRDLVSYAADALWNERWDLFAAHLDWYQGFLDRRGVEPDALPRLLDVLRRESTTVTPASSGESFRALLGHDLDLAGQTRRVPPTSS